MSGSSWVHIDVEEILRETEKALLCLIDGEEVWIPLSQIENQGEDYKAGDKDCSMCVTEWIAKEKGL